MLDHLGEKQAAGTLMQAIEAVVRDGKTKTPDLGGRATTAEMTDALCSLIRSKK
jgi:tartrate dehydrogenase/decarboxylase/D-malate dehydrogenase